MCKRKSKRRKGAVVNKEQVGGETEGCNPARAGKRGGALKGRWVRKNPQKENVQQCKKRLGAEKGPPGTTKKENVEAD